MINKYNMYWNRKEILTGDHWVFTRSRWTDGDLTFIKASA